MSGVGQSLMWAYALFLIFVEEFWQLMQDPTPMWLTLLLVIGLGSALDTTLRALRELTKLYVRDRCGCEEHEKERRGMDIEEQEEP